MRVEEAFAAAGLNIRGEPIPAHRIIVKCANCSSETTADKIAPTESGAQTNYECPNCSETVLTVSPAPGLGGYRLGDWVVNPTGGMMLDVPPEGEPL